MCLLPAVVVECDTTGAVDAGRDFAWVYGLVCWESRVEFITNLDGNSGRTSVWDEELWK